jgi:hypothetical protein
MGWRAEAFYRQRLSGDEQGPIGADAGYGPEQSHSGLPPSHKLDSFVEGSDHGSKLSDEVPLHSDEETLLGPERRPSLGADPAITTPGEEVASRHMQANAVESSMDAAGRRRAQMYQPGSVPKESGLFTLLDGLGVDFGNETS